MTFNPNLYVFKLLPYVLKQIQFLLGLNTVKNNLIKGLLTNFTTYTIVFNHVKILLL